VALTERQQRFVEAYLETGNASEAAVRAGTTSKDPNKAGYKFLHDPEVADSIAKAQGERAKRAGLTADAVLEGIQRIAKKAEGEGDWPAALKAHELLGKHLRLFIERVEHSGKVSLVDLVVGDS